MKLGIELPIIDMHKAMRKAGSEGTAFSKAGAVVGYTAPYAVYIHENLEIKHPQHRSHNCGGQAKYLEQPAREQGYLIGSAVITSYQATRDAGEAMVAGGQMLQRLSQALVPVDTGALRASAFTHKTTGNRESRG